MNEPIKSDLDASAQTEKQKQIPLLLGVVGIVAAISLVFFFYALYRMRNSWQTPQIFEVKQIGATDHAVLIAWSCSKEVDQFIVKGKTDSGQSLPEMHCQTPFAAVESLEPNRHYQLEVAPVANGQEYDAVSLRCTTEKFGRVTDVSATDVGKDFIEVSWKNEGADNGFVAVAYALDKEGKRHFTSDKVTVPAGQTHCRITGLLSNLRYTVAVMPLTKYGAIGKSVVTTTEYSELYKDIKIARFVICSFSSENNPAVHQLKTVEPSSPYQTSLIISGKAAPSDSCNMTIYITDAEDQLICKTTHMQIALNPEGKPSYIQRMMLLHFYSPPQEGDFSLYLAFDGTTVKREPFHVKKAVT